MNEKTATELREPSEPTELTVEQKRRRIRELYEEGWNRHTLPFMKDLKTADGKAMERYGRASSGAIEFENVPSDDDRIYSVSTGTGFIALEHEPQFITKEVTGCQAVLIRGKTNDGKPLSAFFHLTPTTKLAWGNFRNEDDDQRWGSERRQGSAKRIVEAIEQVGGDRSTLKAHLIRTAGSPPKPYYYGYAEDRLKEKNKDLVSAFAAQGVEAQEVEPLQLETATIYWTPEKPDEIFAVGEKVIVRPEGGVIEPERVEDRGVDERIVKLK